MRDSYMTIAATGHSFSERQSAILAQVTEHGFVTIEAFAAQLGVSAQTIRRDIIELSRQGRVTRFHGGAGPAEATEATRLDYSEKRTIGRQEKASVGRKAAALVPDGSTLYLDVGTTIEACAKELAARPGFTIFTNSMRAAMAFDQDRHRVFVLGGRLAGPDGSLVGEDIVQKLTEVHLDYAMVACSAIDDTGRVMDFDMGKIAIKRAAISVASKSFLLATQSKFNRKALSTIAQVDQFDEIVTE